MKTIARILAPLLIASGLVLGIQAASDAHTPKGYATCDGYYVTATSYESRNTNTISSTFDGVTTQRNFATSDSITGPWPQDGVAHTWSGFVHTNNSNPAYSKDYGPITLTCGPPPPPSQHQTRTHSTKPTCKHPFVIKTTEARDKTFAWDGTKYVGTWSAWYQTSRTKTKVDLTKQCARHTMVRDRITEKCNCWRDKVLFFHGPAVKLKVTHPSRLVWIAHATGKVINGHQYLLPSKIGGHSGWAKTQTYRVKTTNTPCPCKKTHTCHRAGPKHQHHSCKTACKLND